MKDSSKICRPSSSCRPPQLFINDIGWNNIEGNLWTQEVKTHHYQNKSWEWSKFS